MLNQLFQDILKPIAPKDPMIGQYLVSVYNGETLIWSRPLRSSRPLKAIEQAFNEMPTSVAVNVLGDMNPGWTIACRQYNDEILPEGRNSTHNHQPQSK